MWVRQRRAARAPRRLNRQRWPPIGDAKCHVRRRRLQQVGSLAEGIPAAIARGLREADEAAAGASSAPKDAALKGTHARPRTSIPSLAIAAAIVRHRAIPRRRRPFTVATTNNASGHGALPGQPRLGE